MKKIDIEYTLSIYSEFFTGGGKGNSYIDSYLLKDDDGTPIIPGSLLKGKLKYYIDLVLMNKRFDKFDDELKLEIKENIFGKEGNNRGLLSFFNAHVTDKSKSKVYSLRTGTTIDRVVRTVKNKALYTIETTVDGIDFVGKIKGFLDENIYKREIYFLALAFNCMDTIGGNQSRGLGFINKEKSTFCIYEGKEKLKDNILSDWKV
jgi:CRISPR/Cas system CSM-associated protein Csm3 (group 7 of RAMP superfamily)